MTQRARLLLFAPVTGCLLWGGAPVARADTAPGEETRARELMALFLRKGQRQPYVGEQITRWLVGRVRETRQIVRYAGPGRMRLEYLDPPAQRGETILITGGSYYHFQPRPRRRILLGVTPPDELRERILELQRRIAQRRIQARAVGEETVASRQAGIVELRPPAPRRPYLRFWIDSETGVRLKYARMDAEGRALTETYFTRIDYDAPIDPAQFRPASLPAAAHEPLLPRTPALPDVAAANALLPYPLREPAPPPGYRLSGIWVVDGPQRKTAILRYTDGVNPFTLFQTPAPRAAQVPQRPARMRNGVAHWIQGGMSYVLIGPLKPDEAAQIQRSLASPVESP